MDKRLRLYYVETDYGCGIRAASNIRQARKDLKDEVGRQAKSVRRATVGDIGWIKAMGGHIPRGNFLIDNEPDETENDNE